MDDPLDEYFDAYDKNGRKLTLKEWGELHKDYSYRIIARTAVGSYLVSTVWLGINHRFFDNGAPIIFETMVFSEDEWNDKDHFGLQDIDCRRYCTEDEARTGHREMVELIEATLLTQLPDQQEQSDPS